MSVKKRSVVIAGHSTSVTLENVFWEALTRIARQRSTSLNALIAEIDQNRARYNADNLSSALRVFVMQELQKNSSPS